MNDFFKEAIPVAVERQTERQLTREVNDLSGFKAEMEGLFGRPFVEAAKGTFDAQGYRYSMIFEIEEGDSWRVFWVDNDKEYLHIQRPDQTSGVVSGKRRNEIKDLVLIDINRFYLFY